MATTLTRYSGRHGLITLDLGGGAIAIVGANKWTYDKTAKLSDATSFGDAHEVELQGLSSRKGKFSGYLDTTSSNTLLTSTDSPIPVTITIEPDTVNLPGTSITGPCWINLSMEGDIKDTIKVDATWSAAPGPAFVETGF